MSYWFTYRIFDKNIDLKPRSSILEGPFASYDAAKLQMESCRGSDLQTTQIFQAGSKEEAEKYINKET